MKRIWILILIVAALLFLYIYSSIGKGPPSVAPQGASQFEPLEIKGKKIPPSAKELKMSDPAWSPPDAQKPTKKVNR